MQANAGKETKRDCLHSFTTLRNCYADKAVAGAIEGAVGLRERTNLDTIVHIIDISFV